jgi:toxin FitB
VIVLDTNVLSEVVRPQPHAGVVAWLDSLDAAATTTTAITVAELLYGVSRLPRGRRREQLTEAVRAQIEDDLAGRVEPFDAAAAVHYASLVSSREQAGRPIGVADGQIAAICRKLGATLATRDVDDFEGTGVELLNPWHMRACGPLEAPGPLESPT